MLFVICCCLFGIRVAFKVNPDFRVWCLNMYIAEILLCIVFCLTYGGFCLRKSLW